MLTPAMCPLHVQGASAEVELRKGDRVTLSTDVQYRECGDRNTVYVDYESIVNLPLDSKIFLDEECISVKVIEKGENHVLTGQWNKLHYGVLNMYSYTPCM